MAYSFEQLVAAYTRVHDGIAPDAATTARLQYFVSLSQNQPTDVQAMNYIVNSVDNSTALATLTYQFFTGKAPTKAGIDYLVNSTDNPNDLNDAYYTPFNIENRYINFSANLGIQGEGAANFATKYGAMSFGDYVASIYQTIIGGAYATAAGIDASKAIADIVSRQAAILATAQSAGMITPNMTAAQIDIALKAATAGYLLAEAIKADIGVYASAANNFMVAVAQGTATYGADIVQTYAAPAGQAGGGGGQPTTAPVVLPAPPAPVVTTPTTPVADGPRTFIMTSAIDTFTGGAGNDTFTADDTNGVGDRAGTRISGDVLDGGAGDDTLNILSNSVSGFIPSPLTVRNIETVNLTSTAITILEAQTWVGVKQMNLTVGPATTSLRVSDSTNVTFNGSRAATIEGGKDVTLNLTNLDTSLIKVGAFFAPTGAVTISAASGNAIALGKITVNGGTTVNVTQTASNAVNTTRTNAVVEVNGSALTTAVTVVAPKAATQSGALNGVNTSTVSIFDATGTNSNTKASIATISIDGYSGVTIWDNAIASLTLAHGTGAVSITNTSVMTDRTTTLNLTLNGVTSGTVSDSGVYETLNITTGTEASAITRFTMSAATAVNVSGASKMTLTDMTGLNFVQTVTVSGAASIGGAWTGASLTSINASATSADITLSINAVGVAYAGGSGVDTITESTSAPNKAVSGGAGTADVLVMNATTAATASGSGAFALKVTDFERLSLTAATNQTIDLAMLGNYNYVTTSSGNGLILNNFTSGGTLVLNAAGTSYTLGSANFGGANDVMNLTLTSAANTAFLSGTGITAPGVETFAVTTLDTRTTPLGVLYALPLAGNDLKTLTISGNAGITLTAASTALTTLDASGVTLGGITWTTGVLAGPATIKGTATGTNNISFSQATGGAVTYVGGSGNDNITGINGKDNVVSLGAGTNTYTGGVGNETVSVGGGANTINVSTGADSVVLTTPNILSTAFTAIGGMSVGAGDTLVFNGQAPTAGVLGAAVGTLGSLALTLDAASASTTGATTPVVKWFLFNGDTYVVLDHSNAATFTAGADYVVKLAGVVDLSNSSLANAGGNATLTL